MLMSNIFIRYVNVIILLLYMQMHIYVFVYLEPHISSSFLKRY